MIQELVNAQAARGRLPGDRAHDPRPPDVLRGDPRGGARGRRLADPRVSARARGPSSAAGRARRPGLLLRLREPALVPRGRAHPAADARRRSSGSRSLGPRSGAAPAALERRGARPRSSGRGAERGLQRFVWPRAVAVRQLARAARGDLREGHRARRRVLARGAAPVLRRGPLARRRRQRADRRVGVRDAPDSGAEGLRAALDAVRARRGDRAGPFARRAHAARRLRPRGGGRASSTATRELELAAQELGASAR